MTQQLPIVIAMGELLTEALLLQFCFFVGAISSERRKDKQCSKSNKGQANEMLNRLIDSHKLPINQIYRLNNKKRKETEGKGTKEIKLTFWGIKKDNKLNRRENEKGKKIKKGHYRLQAQKGGKKIWREKVKPYATTCHYMV